MSRKRIAFVLAGLFAAGLLMSASYWLSQFFSGDSVGEAVVMARTVEGGRPASVRDPMIFRPLEAKLMPEMNPLALVLTSWYVPSRQTATSFELTVEDAATGDVVFSKPLSLETSTQARRTQSTRSRRMPLRLKADATSRLQRVAVFSVAEAGRYQIRMTADPEQPTQVLALDLGVRSNAAALPIGLFIAGVPCMMLGLLGLILLLITLPTRGSPA